MRLAVTAFLILYFYIAIAQKLIHFPGFKINVIVSKIKADIILKVK